MLEVCRPAYPPVRPRRAGAPSENGPWSEDTLPSLIITLRLAAEEGLTFVSPVSMRQRHARLDGLSVCLSVCLCMRLCLCVCVSVATGHLCLLPHEPGCLSVNSLLGVL